MYALDSVGRYCLTLVAACLTLAFQVTRSPWVQYNLVKFYCNDISSLAWPDVYMCFTWHCILLVATSPELEDAEAVLPDSSVIYHQVTQLPVQCNCISIFMHAGEQHNVVCCPGTQTSLLSTVSEEAECQHAQAICTMISRSVVAHCKSTVAVTARSYNIYLFLQG